MMFGNTNFLFFCEDALAGQRSDIFGRDIGPGPDSGKFFTLVEATPTSTLGDRETTGLAFSPGNEFMYVTYQLEGVYKFWRTDGKPFSARLQMSNTTQIKKPYPYKIWSYLLDARLSS